MRRPELRGRPPSAPGSFSARPGPPVHGVAGSSSGGASSPFGLSAAATGSSVAHVKIVSSVLVGLGQSAQGQVALGLGQSVLRVMSSPGGQCQAKVTPKGTSKLDPALAYSEIIDDVA